MSVDVSIQKSKTVDDQGSHGATCHSPLELCSLDDERGPEAFGCSPLLTDATCVLAVCAVAAGGGGSRGAAG